MADCREWVWVVSEPEFGYMAGNNVMMIKALYGKNSYVASFRAFLAETLYAMGYRPS